MILDHSNNVVLHLALIDGVGAATIMHIIEHCKKTYALSDIYRFSANDWQKLFGCSQKMSEVLRNGLADRTSLEEELRLIERHKAQWITILDSKYPQQLRAIHYPPPVLWWHGSSWWLEHEWLFSVVGSRKANYYAQDVVDSFVPTLTRYNWTIVSGGALGVDGMAHTAALKSGGRTIVVLGSGLTQLYPQSHASLFKMVLEKNSAIVSIFPMQTNAHPINFPLRNRVVSGLSRGCLVVQAATKSGARITAQHALEQGRDVFAVPGSIKDPLSAGCHDLIKQGAHLVTKPEDIIQSYHGVRAPQLLSEAASESEGKKELYSMEEKIIAACAKPLSIDELLIFTQFPLHELQSLLFHLQLEGKIHQDFAGMWTL